MTASWMPVGFSRRLFLAALGFLLILPYALPAKASDSGPARVTFVGDSMADGLWGAFFRRLGKDKCLAEKVKAIRQAKNGTGLARLDRFDWAQEIGAMAANPGSELFVGSFGLNDRQAIVDSSKARTEYGTPEFAGKYAAIVEDVIKSATSHGGSILVIGLPVMLDKDADADARAKNKIFAAAVANAGSPRAAFVAPWTWRAGSDEYRPYLPNSSNVQMQVRANDGIHFTQGGYDLVMDYLFPIILDALKASGRASLRECS